jgi:hypothetical protein
MSADHIICEEIKTLKAELEQLDKVIPQIEKSNARLRMQIDEHKILNALVRKSRDRMNELVKEEEAIYNEKDAVTKEDVAKEALIRDSDGRVIDGMDEDVGDMDRCEVDKPVDGDDDGYDDNDSIVIKCLLKRIEKYKSFARTMANDCVRSGRWIADSFKSCETDDDTCPWC